MRFQVQGYAIPWEREGYGGEDEDGRTWIAARNSISPPRPEGANVTLIFGDHVTEGRRVYSQTRDRTLSFFADDYGLGFSAWLDDDTPGHFAVKQAIANGSVTNCSVNMIAPYDRIDEEGRRRFTHARIDHVTMCSIGVFQDTGLWLADVPYRERAPWLLDMSFRYGESVLARNRVASSAAPVAASYRVEKTAQTRDGSSAAPRRSVLDQIDRLLSGTRRHVDRQRLLVARLTARGATGVLFNGYGEVPESVTQWLHDFENQTGMFAPPPPPPEPPHGALEAYEAAMRERVA